jgi:hypothetical protein
VAAISILTEPIRLHEDPPLVWDQRATWLAFEVRYKTLERGMMSAARTNEQFKDTGFHPDAELRAAVAASNALAARFDGTSADAALVDDAKELVESYPTLFQPHFLLATAYRAAGNAEAADASFTRTFELAPAALLQRFTLPTTELAARYRVDDVTIGYDEVIENPEGSNRVVQEMTLLYPALRADEDGEIYLPVFKTILRIADTPRPGKPIAKSVDPEGTAWFTFPGNLGRLETAVAPIGLR